MTIEAIVLEIAAAARKAGRLMSQIPTAQKNQALMTLADQLETDSERIFSANAKDVEQAGENGLSNAMIDRLKVTDATIRAMADGLREVAALGDPVGAMDESCLRPNGLEVSRMRVPLGVIGIIYESRPNVTVDAAGLCLKAGNAVILRGGSEAIHSNRALADLITASLTASGLPGKAVQVIPVTDRAAVTTLLAQESFIDLIIPRGGEGLIRFVVANSKIPVLKHYKGVCHVYVDQDADLGMAEDICFNAKVQRPGVCNAMETLLVDQSVADRFLPKVGRRLKDAGVTIRGCGRTRQRLAWAEAADDSDWPAEYLDLVLAVRVVDDLDQAMAHIADHGSNHTEVIVTRNYSRARRFIREVDASAVIVNASTRFNDGGQLGLGAEIGISTSKLHAYGPMGLKELTTTKFVVFGDGQVRTT
ncbi:MAG: glutamate-5-semialdehyde dehydrogenase [Deltaproteobacteria bacterium]|nr:MAG: glutamate-5-semialdehyde dehydrogenase [Deltaproteobacteria bacterium]